MFDEDIQINIYQVPYPRIYTHMRRNGVKTLDISYNILAINDRLIVDTIYDTFMWYGPKALQKLMYSEKIKMKVSRDKNNNKILSKLTLETFFTEILSKYDINEISEIWKYPDSRIPKLK